MRSWPAAASAATAATTAPASRSVTRMTTRRGKRSANAPPKSTKMSDATLKMAPQIPISRAPPPSARIWNGSATLWTKFPTTETVWPVHRSRKSRWRSGSSARGMRIGRVSRMRRRELAGHMQRTEAVEVGSYMTASPADATPRLLERIERHYAGVGKPSRIAVATGMVPLATTHALERRGYRPTTGESELIYIYDRRTPPAMPDIDGLTIERAGPQIATLYSQTGFESFNDRGPEFVAIVEAILRSRRRGLRAFLGRIDGEAAATGMLFDVRPVGGLGNGSVRPAFRGRGLQKAMIAHRIRDGWARGYRLFFGQTVNPVSAHNMEDLGWRKLYTEVAWEKLQ